jgi:hypothetical protein
MNLFDIKFLLALYLVQLTGLTNNTLGKQLKEYVYSNRMIQHIINVVFLIVLISMLDDQRSLTNITISSLVLYIIYIFTTKLDLQYNLLILAFALFYYFYKREVNKQIRRVSDDNDIDSNLKNMIVKLDENKEMIFGSGLLLVLAYFVYIYVSRKSVQYGGGFSYSKFLMY